VKKLEWFIDDERIIFNDTLEEPGLSPYYFFFEELKNPSITYVSKNPSTCSGEEALKKVKWYFREKYNKCVPTMDINKIYQTLRKNLDSARIEIV